MKAIVAACVLALPGMLRAAEGALASGMIDIGTNGAVAVMPADGVAAFVRGNMAYIGTNYPAAAAYYQAALDAGFRAGGVYYNLGNAWYRCARLGKAIAAYRHAQVLLPRDSDVAENLATARLQQGSDTLASGERSGAVRAFLFLYYYVSPDETLWGFCICLASFFVMLTWHWFRPQPWLRHMKSVMLVCALVLAVSGATHVYWTHAGTEGVVIVETVAVRSGPSEGATGLFVLNDGAEIKVTGREAGWIKIKAAEKNGWVPDQALEVL